MREFSFHEKKLTDAIQADPDRKNREIAHQRAYVSKALKLPLVHRTGEGPLTSIAKAGYLLPPENPTAREAALNLTPAVYFFYGAGPYPNGRIALVFNPGTANQGNSEFSPFDSGAVSRLFLEPTVTDGNWSDPRVREDFLADHTGDCKDLHKFALHYLNAHFRDIKDYVRWPMESTPDWRPYHGLKSCKGADRRAWTIETRFRDRVSFELLRVIILDSANWLFRASLGDEVFGGSYPDVILAEDLLGGLPPDDILDRLEAAVATFIIDEYFER